MNYSFEYIDIILLAMIAGFIFLRLRGILGKKTGQDENIGASFAHDFPTKKKEFININENNFDEKAKADFLKGAKIAYETVVTCFASGNIKEIKNLLDKKIINDFSEAIKERKNKFEVTVDFVSEIISCVEDKDKKLVSGDPKKVKKVYDTWKFSRDIKSLSPNWLLIDTQA